MTSARGDSMHSLIEGNRKELGEFCRRWRITEFSLFGSVLRVDFRPDSDVDCLVTFASDARWTLFDMARMQEELEALFARKIHIVTRRGLESSRNYLRREAILSSAEVVDVT
jgi:predicted nucleotidyltransferase